MSGGFSLFPEIANGFSAGLSATNGGTLVQGGTGAAHTKGSWVQLIASSSGDAAWAMVKIFCDNTVNANTNNSMVDIGIGAAASEVVIAANLHSNNFPGLQQETFVFPVAIPAATRIAARAQADATSLNSVYVSIILFGAGFTSPVEAAGLTDIGTVTASTQLTAVTFGTSGAKGSYVQLMSSTASDYAGLLIKYSCHSLSGNPIILLDVAVGGAGSEQIIIPDFALLVLGSAGYTIGGANWFPFFTPIPAGTRISARGSTSGGASPTASQMAVYGILQ